MKYTDRQKWCPASDFRCVYTCITAENHMHTYVARHCMCRLKRGGDQGAKEKVVGGTPILHLSQTSYDRERKQYKTWCHLVVSNSCLTHSTMNWRSASETAIRTYGHRGSRLSIGVSFPPSYISDVGHHSCRSVYMSRNQIKYIHNPARQRVSVITKRLQRNLVSNA